MNKKQQQQEQVLLAYSGGLDTSVICKWLTLRGYTVVAYVGDVGQAEDLQAAAAKARAAGAVDVIVDDLRAAFVTEFVLRAASFQAYYEGRYLLGTALARPVVARGMVRVAEARGIHVFAHGATGKGNDQVRFELAFYALMKDARVIAPWRDSEFYTQIAGRQEAIAFAKEHGITITATPERPWSSDGNLMHISFEAGMLEDAAVAPREDMFAYSCSPQAAPQQAVRLCLEFARSVPVALNGKQLPPYKLLAQLNQLGGAHGIGRIDIVESRFVGMKSRGVYETPGATILYAALRDLQCLTLPGDLLVLKDKLAIDFATLVYRGMWFSPMMEALLAFVQSTEQAVNGTVDIELYKGNVIILGRSSPTHSLYAQQLASMEADGGAYCAEDAAGFIRLQALPLQQWRKRNAG